ncbi:MAG TPA: ABC transporter substrate-binding protein [Opitutaceae bacterium]|nr:ABC transporter substrate-binding protein [Opitutaceae bacterium]
MLPIRTLVILAAVVFALAGCKQRTGGAPTTFIFAHGSDVQKLDPADVDDGESVNTLAQVMEGLVRFRDGTFEIDPCLAERWTITPDGLTYTFTIREGVRFHDGTPLDAEAARYSFARQMDPAHPAHLPGANYQYWNYLYQEVAAVEATDPRTLVFRLSRPNASLLASLAIFPAWLVSPSTLATYGAADFQRHAVGTGPYKFASWTPNQALVLERNADYWDKSAPPQFERIVMKVVPENTVRLLELRAGTVHGIDGLQPAELTGLRGDPNLRVHAEPGMNVGYLAWNLDNPKFAEAEVRKAFAMAINLEELQQVALDGAGTIARLPIPPGFLGDTGQPRAVEYNPDEARRILAKYADRWKDPVTLHVMSAPRAYLPEPVKGASLIRAAFERVGVRVEIVAKDFKTHLDITREGAFEMAILGWVGDNGDTDNFLSIFLGSWAAVKGAATNISFYKNDEMDRLLLGARAEVDSAVRAELYRQALELWRRDLPIFPFLHGDNIAVMRREVTGFKLQGTGELKLGGIGWSSE